MDSDPYILSYKSGSSSGSGPLLLNTMQSNFLKIHCLSFLIAHYRCGIVRILQPIFFNDHKNVHVGSGSGSVIYRLYQIRRPLGLVFVIYHWWLGKLLLLYI
jgi:hypothetical protein